MKTPAVILTKSACYPEEVKKALKKVTKSKLVPDKINNNSNHSTDPNALEYSHSF